MLDLLAGSPALLIPTVAVLGLLVGSFLNVLSLRLPRMMEQAWRAECRTLLELPEETPAGLSLLSPPSTCPACGAAIRPWHNLPVLGWLLLRGRAACCGARISLQYPLVEGATGLVSAVCAWRFGWSPQLAAALVLSWGLIALTVIDLREQLLPDDITFPLVWLGLGLSLVPVFAHPASSIVGALAGYLSLWSIYWLFKLLTGKEGMGYGDFKLLMALGAWLGWQALPGIILLSALVGTLVGLCLIVFRRHDRHVPIAFGPYLAGAGWIALICGASLPGLVSGLVRGP